MSTEQTYDKCQYFATMNLCPHGKDEFMKQFTFDQNASVGTFTGFTYLKFDKAEEINKNYCDKCNSFKLKSKN